MTQSKPRLISTEKLIVSPEAFGVKTASPCQRAACRILDGLPLGELAEDPAVSQFVGGPDALKDLPNEHGEQPIEVVFLSAIRSLKTITAAAAAIRMSQTVDVSGLGPGEIPRVSIVSLKLDTSGVAFRILAETIRSSARLKSLLVGEPTADSLTVLHPTGRHVEITCVAGAKAGSGLVARWSAGVIFDEAPRMVGAEDGVVNLDDARSAVLGRLLPGAQALYVGSPWAPFGPVYDLVQEHWRRPTPELVVLRGTGPMLNPYWWTPERCARLKKQNPAAYRTDVEGEFADPESTLFASEVLKRQTRERPEELGYNPRLTYSAAMDPATRGNAWTLVVSTCTSVETRDGRQIRKYAVACARQWIGSKVSPLSPEVVLREIGVVLRMYGVTNVTSDQWAADALCDLARRVGLSLNIVTIGAGEKLDMFEGLRLLLEGGELELPPLPVMREDLSRVRKRLTATGFTIQLPTTGDGRHADYAPALALSVRWPIAAPKELTKRVHPMQAYKQRLMREMSERTEQRWRDDPEGELRRRILGR